MASPNKCFVVLLQLALWKRVLCCAPPPQFYNHQQQPSAPFAGSNRYAAYGVPSTNFLWRSQGANGLDSGDLPPPQLFGPPPMAVPPPALLMDQQDPDGGIVVNSVDNDGTEESGRQQQPLVPVPFAQLAQGTEAMPPIVFPFSPTSTGMSRISAPKPSSPLLPPPGEVCPPVVNDYETLLKSLEVEPRPFDGLILHSGGELPSPVVRQTCSFDADREQKETCSFFSAEEAQLQFSLGRFCNGTRVEHFPGFGESFARLTRRPVGDHPSGYFIAVIEPDVAAFGRSALLRLEVPCQRGDGKLGFSYWSTNVHFGLKVCTRLNEERQCTSAIVYSPEMSRVDVQVVNPNAGANGPFSVEIIANGFYEPSILLLDNLEYGAEPCPLEHSELAPKTNSQITLEHSAKESESKFPIQVEGLETFPRHSVSPIDRGVFSAKGTRVHSSRSGPVVEGSVGPRNRGGAVVVNGGVTSGDLGQAVDGNQEADKHSHDDQWHVKQNRSRLGLFRREMLKLAGEHDIVELGNGAVDQEQMAVPRVSGLFRGGDAKSPLLLGDRTSEPTQSEWKTDVRLQALHFFRALRKMPSAAARRRAATVCELLSCSFSEGFCHYTALDNSPAAAKIRLRKWKIAKPHWKSLVAGPAGQANTLQYSGYAYIGNEQLAAAPTKRESKQQEGGQRRRTMYILQSAEFALKPNASAELLFDLYKRSNTASLQVCLNSVMNCVYEAPYVEANAYWRKGERVALPDGTKRIYIVATQWRRAGWMAIDNIRLLQHGREQCQ